MVVDTIRQARKRLLPKEKVLELDRLDEFPEAIIRELLGPEYGLQLLFIPEAYGGIGGGTLDTCMVVEEISKICLGVATGFFALQLGSEPILGGATEEQKKKWLGRICEGESLVAYAVTEAEAGSNLASLKTTAEPITDASGAVTGYTINGSKQFISTGAYADFLTVLARTPEGPTFFIVEKDAKGFSASKGEEKHGIRASNTSALTFEDVVVPVENLVGDVPGEGLVQASRVFGYTRLMVASMALGAGESALKIALPYAQERVQFGTTLSEKQGYTHKLIVPHVVRLAAARAYVEETAIRLDSCAENMQVEGAIAKFFTTETANALAEAAIQALGGYGYICEYEVEKIKRDVRITCIYEGTSEILQNVISTFRWRTSRKSKGDFYGSIASEMEALHTEHPRIGAEAYGLAASALNEAIAIATEHKLTKQQSLMFALSEMMTHVEVGAALARKAAGLIADGHPEAERFRLTSRIFSADAARLVATKLAVLASDSDALDEAAVASLLDRLDYPRLMVGCGRGLTAEMDAFAHILFDRQPEA